MRSKNLLALPLAAVALLFAIEPLSRAADVTYAYDPNTGRLDHITYDNGTIVKYSYDANGNRTGATFQAWAPETPSSLTVTSAYAGDVALSWTGSDGAAGYYIERCQGSGCTNFTQIGTASGTSYADTSASPGTTYTYEVVAYGSFKGTTVTSLASNAPSATTPLLLTVGSGQTIQLSTSGSSAQLSFAVSTATASLALSIGAMATTPTNSPLTLSVYDSNGHLVTSTSTTGGVFHLPRLAVGNYTVDVSLQNSATGSFRITLENLSVISIIVNFLLNN